MRPPAIQVNGIRNLTVQRTPSSADKSARKVSISLSNCFFTASSLINFTLSAKSDNTDLSCQAAGPSSAI